DHRVDLHRHVVARDHVLRRHLHHDRAQVDPDHLLHHRDQDDDARPLHRLKAAEQEHHAAVVLAQDLDRGQQDDQYDDDDHRDDGIRVHGGASFETARGFTSRTRPCMAVTETAWPRWSGTSQRACQRSPCTCTAPRPSKSATTSPIAPIISSRPLTTGRLCERIAIHTMPTRMPAAAIAMPTTTGSAMP